MAIDFQAVYESAKKRHEEFLEVFEKELRLMGESYGGLYSLIVGEEDYTCMTAKKLLGKRDKNWGSTSL
ncbi:MAG: hypothetical protein ABWJ97_02395 [Thermoproteus sp.]